MKPNYEFYPNKTFLPFDICCDPGWFNSPSHRHSRIHGHGQGYGDDLQNMDMVMLILVHRCHVTLVIAGAN